MSTVENDAMEEAPDNVSCPLVGGEMIDAGDCIENRDIADGNIKERHLPDKFKVKTDWRSICKNCRWHYF